jgi:hypothetical protein
MLDSTRGQSRVLLDTAWCLPIVRAIKVPIHVHGRALEAGYIGTYLAISLADARQEAGKVIRDAQLGTIAEVPAAAKPTLGKNIPIFHSALRGDAAIP